MGTWPQIGVDIVPLDVSSRERLLAVMCTSLDASPLFSQWSSSVVEALPPSVVTDDTGLDQAVGEALRAYGGSLASECFVVMSFEGRRAVGVGSNVKKRIRAGRVALAVTLEIQEGWGVMAELQPAVESARQAMSMEGLPLVQPLVEEVSQPTLRQNVAPGENGQKFLSPTGPTRVDPTAPRECLEDPLMELRPWTYGNGHEEYLWPWCTACGCWLDRQHFNGHRHQKAVKAAEWEFSQYPGGLGLEAHMVMKEHLAWPVKPVEPSVPPPPSTKRLASPPAQMQAPMDDGSVPPPPPGQPRSHQKVPPPPPPPTAPLPRAGTQIRQTAPQENEVPLPACRWQIAELAREATAHGSAAANTYTGNVVQVQAIPQEAGFIEV